MEPELTADELYPVLKHRPMRTSDLSKELRRQWKGTAGAACRENPVRLEGKVCTDPCFPSEGRRKHRHVRGLPGLRMARF